MKKIIAVILIIIFIMGLCTSCKHNSNNEKPNVITEDSVNVESENSTLENRISFLDINFEKGIREIIDKPTEEIFLSDVNSIETLDLGELGITDISGIEHFKSLKELDLRENKIENVDNLALLTGLSFLRLSENHISDITSVDT